MTQRNLVIGKTRDRVLCVALVSMKCEKYLVIQVKDTYYVL